MDKGAAKAEGGTPAPRGVSYPPDNHHSSDVVYPRGGDNVTGYHTTAYSE